MPHFPHNWGYVFSGQPGGLSSQQPFPRRRGFHVFRQIAPFISRAALAAILFAGVPAAGIAGLESAVAAPVPDSFADLADRLSPAVVNISTTQELKRPSREDFPFPQLPEGSPFEEFFKEFFDQQQQRGPTRVNSLGSGFVIDPKGVIVTNNHVIADADEIEVTFTDGTKLKATIIGRDERTDVAVLQVKADHDLPYVSFANSDTARVGEWVMAIGNPFGLGGSVSVGIISARNRDINAGYYDDFIQTDAAINRGNSGGPLFNMNGEVVGVNTAIISPSGGSIGIGFAIPANDVQRVVDQLRQYGEARRGWIGVRLQSLNDDMAEGLGIDKARGALVAEVTPDSPAAKGGVLQGDVIITFDGKEVSAMRSLPRIVATTEIGRAVQVEVLRKGQPVTLTITVGKSEEKPQSASASPGETPQAEQPGVTATQVDTLGLSLSPITDELRAKYEIPAEVKGVVVTSIKGKSPAGYAQAENRIREGDVIVEVQQETVMQASDVTEKVKKVVDSNGKVVLLLLSRKGELSFAALRLDQS
ncbi:MAG: DegQ family serine endoprotease [Alphaproteobacteria bacterium]|nr:DegQ family serine endoprotease [Alphaproteobacteria bacterium]